MFGFLFGGGSTKNQRKLKTSVDFLTDVTFSSIQRNVTSCRPAMSSVNVVDIECVNDGKRSIGEKQSQCLRACAALPEDMPLQNVCVEGCFKPDCDIGNINQRIMASLDVDCHLDQQATTKVKKDIKSSIDTQLKKTEDAISRALSDAVTTVFGGKSDNSSDIDISQKLHNIIDESFTNENINEMVASLKVSNKLHIKSQGATLRLAGLDQDARVAAMYSMLSKSSTFNDMTTVLSSSSTTEDIDEERGFADIVSSVMDMIKSIGMTWALVLLGLILVGPMMFDTIFGGE